MKLTSQERVRRCFSGEPIDRMPFYSFSILPSAGLAGLSSEAFYLDPKKSFEAQTHTLRMFHCDSSPGFDFPGWHAWDLGNEIEFSKKQDFDLPIVVSRAITSVEEALRFEFKDPWKGTAFQKRIEFYDIAVNNGLSASLPASSPSEILAYLMEPTLLLRWYFKEKKAVSLLLDRATDHIIRMIDIYLDRYGLERCSAYTSYPFESNGLISPKTFETLLFPFISKIHAHLTDRGIGARSIHFCGDHTRNLEIFHRLDLPEGSYLHADDKTDLDRIDGLFGSGYVLSGNVPTTLFTSGTYDEVVRYCEKLIAKYKDRNGGFILAPACDLPPNAIPLNILAMYDAVEAFGTYE